MCLQLSRAIFSSYVLLTYERRLTVMYNQKTGIVVHPRAQVPGLRTCRVVEAQRKFLEHSTLAFAYSSVGSLHSSI
jgi:hypothetical protein